jgi:hypothetical protein
MMLDTFKELIANQFEAAFCTLNACIDRCPMPAWDARVANYKFCQVAFHTLFYADLHLGPNEESFPRQPFHRDHSDFFRDYEEFEDREPTLLYDKQSISNYMAHCRKKASDVIASETEESLVARAGFARRTFSRAELHVYNIRHIQHHAAQLSLRLRLDTLQHIPWIGSGWRENANCVTCGESH